MYITACAIRNLEPGLYVWAALRLALLATTASASGAPGRGHEGPSSTSPVLRSPPSPPPPHAHLPDAEDDPWEDILLNYSSSSTLAPYQSLGVSPLFPGNDSFPADWDEEGDHTFLFDGNKTGGVGVLTGGNASGTETATADEPFSDVLVMGIISVILGLMILVTVIGNVFVIAAILLERNLQSVANYLIVSLAVADLMVACLVMPLGAVYEISKGWILGPELCDMWTSSDVLCCTASILHLVAIAVDRYWAVTNVDYIHTRNSNRICAMIAVVWSVALVVSLAPQFGWKDPDYLDRINVQRRCLVSQDVAYQIFATCSTFYVPLLVILVLYWKIFQTARKRIRRRTGGGNKAAAKKLQDSANSGASSSTRKKAAAAAAAVAAAAAAAAAEATSTSTIGSTTGPGAAAVALKRGEGAVGGEDGADGEDDDDDEEEDEEEGGGLNRDSVAQETTAFTITSPSSVTGIENHAVAATELAPSPGGGAKAANNGAANSRPAAVPGHTVVNPTRADGGSVVPATPTGAAPGGPPAIRDRVERRDKKETLEAKRERKAAKTLAIITGAFVVCWLPFFIMALLMPLCLSCEINEHVASLFLWLGYFNSTLNPVIYTIFSPEFRNAFKRILCGRASARSSYRPRKLR
ncbi:5-hydroxytryptamine receptor-like [Hetaerina americana]|uniref:5-hydroxytryptamine receptor-like n=1 Tax=Hetaerina americana TaxID=62018 RepID=UPI003A7F279C